VLDNFESLLYIHFIMNYIFKVFRTSFFIFFVILINLILFSILLYLLWLFIFEPYIVEILQKLI